MKKCTAFLLVLILLSLLCIPAFAAEQTVLDVIREQDDLDGFEYFLDESLYNQKLKDYLAGRSLQDAVFMRVYPIVYYNYAAEDLAYIESKAMEEVAVTVAYSQYYVFADEPIRIGQFESKGSMQIAEIDSDGIVPSYIHDILKSSYSSIDNPLKKVVCFDGYASHEGIAVYFVGEQSTEVWFYRSNTSKAVIFSLSEFQDYGPRYDAYRKDNAYNEDGEPTGGMTPFLDWVEEHTDFDVPDDLDYVYELDNSGETSKPEPAQPNMPEWIIPTVIGILIVLIGGVAVVILLRKKARPS